LRFKRAIIVEVSVGDGRGNPIRFRWTRREQQGALLDVFSIGMDVIRNSESAMEPNDNSANPLVSIVTVCLNAERTIQGTIDSVLGQTYTHLDYIIVDGKSSDRTLEIVRECEARSQGRLRWISERDSGIYDAMNKGIALAKGTIVGIINSDDWYEPDAVQRVVESYRVHGAGVHYGILRVLDHDQEIMLRLIHWRYLHREVVGHPAFFVTRDIYQRHGRFDLVYKIAADYDLMMRFIDKRVPFHQIDEILANFSQGGKSTSSVSVAVEEWARIRNKYGYLSRLQMYAQIVRRRVSCFLQRWNGSM
jgi:glycosyltransferase involved in cell wall biosynthesis